MFESMRPREGAFGPLAAVSLLREALPDDGVLTCDVGAHLHAIGQLWRTPNPGSLIMTNGWSSMGFGIPALSNPQGSSAESAARELERLLHADPATARDVFQRKMTSSTDWEASEAELEALGHRLIKKDTRKSYQLLIRASALDDGNIEHLAWLSDQAFGATDINGEPQIVNLQRQYELAALAVRLGDDPGKTNYLRDELLRLGIAEAKLVRLDTRVDVLFQSMRDIQRTVVGEITIGGQGDV